MKDSISLFSVVVFWVRAKSGDDDDDRPTDGTPLVPPAPRPLAARPKKEWERPRESEGGRGDGHKNEQG